MSKRAKIITTTVVALLSAGVIVLAVLFGLSASEGKRKGIELENMYQYEYYALIENLLITENELAKVAVCPSPILRENFLQKASTASRGATTNLSKMVAEDTQVNSLIKITNQISEYSEHLLKKVDTGLEITPQELTDIGKMREILRDVVGKFNGLSTTIAERELSGEKGKKEMLAVFSSTLGELTEMADALPLFDFPTNSCLLENDTEPLGLSGEEISLNEAISKLKGYFSQRNIDKIESIGESTFKMGAYVLQFEVDGVVSTAQISKKGGQLVNFFQYTSIDDPQFTPEQGLAVAKVFLEELGFSGLREFACFNSNSVLYCEYAPEQGGVLLVGDKVSVKVSLQDGKVMGYDASCYYKNHTRRNIPEAKISQETAMSLLTGLEMPEISLQYLKLGRDEHLCYVVIGIVGGEKYKIAVDATTGKELFVKRIMEGENGYVEV